MSKRLFRRLDQLIELQKEQNHQLDRITALLVGQQLLTECVDYQGNARSPEDCAEITIEGFSAALCLMGELDQRNREYQYQKSEFFLDDEDEDEDDEDDGPVMSSSF
jgi:hypothetical protein